MGYRARSLAAVFVVTLVAALGAGVEPAPARAAAAPADAVDLDVLFIGAHPDDEASTLSTLGQWNEYHDVSAGVITITRGEGGGNAIGTEEGPALGLIREAEERRAVSRAGIENIYNLDFVDFWFNLSAPLTEELWDRDELRERIVRVVRYTRPDVIITMNPGINHGHHQLAAWLAVEAYDAAADPGAYPHQIRDEGLQAWRVGRIFTTRALGTRTSGPGCESAFVPAEPTDVVRGVWSGRFSERHGKTWAAVERDAQREYATQGWHVFPDVPTDPNQLGCDYFTVIDSRAPFSLNNTSPTAMLEGIIGPAEGGMAAGSELFLELDRFRTTAGRTVNVTAHVTNGGRAALEDAAVELSAPAGWSVDPARIVIGDLPPNRPRTAAFTVTPPTAAAPGRVRLSATLRSGTVAGTTHRAVEVVPAVQGTAAFHPDVQRFREWTREVGAEQVDTLIQPRVPIPSGQSTDLRIELTNHSEVAQSGTVRLEVPAGFSVDQETRSYSGIAAGATGSVTFTVTNTDATLPTGNEGGDYVFTVVTTSADETSEETAAFNLVPATTVPQATAAPDVDGVAAEGEYGGDVLDVGRLWEGEAVSADDASGTARLTWYDDALYVFVDVTDDVLGTVVAPEDAKRHWRTDSVELTIDPRGASRDTSTTFKVGLFPITDDPEGGNPPAGYRDADNYQGPIAQTAPGMELASVVRQPYDGYALEVKIPMAELPAAVDAQQMRFNTLIYDSDTQDLTGQTRLAWSPWGAVQASPYLWGAAALDGYTPPPDRSTEPKDPIIPLDVARSVESPQSILQSTRDGVPLGGGPRVRPGAEARMIGDPVLSGDTVVVRLQAGDSGVAHVFAWTGTKAAAHVDRALARGKSVEVRLPVTEDVRGGLVLVAFEAARGGTNSLAASIR